MQLLQCLFQAKNDLKVRGFLGIFLASKIRRPCPMVMNILRKRMKIVIWVAAVAFIALIFLAWGMDITRSSPTNRLQRGIVGAVNGRVIRIDAYREALRRSLASVRDQTGGEVDDLTATLIEDRVFQQIVQDELLREEIVRRGLRTTEAEIVSFMKNVPPEELRSDTSLMTDGRFDVEKYRKVFQNPANLPWLVEYERYVREALPREKLMLTIYSTARLTDLEIADAFSRQYAKVEVNYLFVPPESKEEETEPTEEDARLYYQSNAEKFRVPFTVRLSYAHFSTAPSDADSASAMEQINGIHDELAAGADFAELADQVSDDRQNSGAGGLVGWIRRGEVVRTFEEAAFSTPIGEISQPFLSEYGWHIVKVDDRQADSVKVSHILVRLEASAETIDKAREASTLFWEDAKEMGFEAAAVNGGVTIQTTPPFSDEGDFVPGIGYARVIKNFAFKAKKGDLSGVLATGEGFYVLRLDEAMESRIPTFEEIADTVALLARHKKEMAVAKVLADSSCALLSGGMSMKQVGEMLGLEYGSGRVLSAAGASSDIPLEVLGAASALKDDEKSKPIETEKGYYVIEVTDRIMPDSETFKSESAALAGRLMESKQRRIVNAWMAGLRKKANISDYRNEAYQ
jgi:peptidyl-prolyl cis-trans isomerase D